MGNKEEPYPKKILTFKRGKETLRVSANRHDAVVLKKLIENTDHLYPIKD